MAMIGAYLVAAAALIWCGLLLLPWRPWGTRERVEATPNAEDDVLDDVTALIPARNEAACIERALRSVARQGRGLRVVLVDDQSSDGTAEIARRTLAERLTLVAGAPVPAGWSGKLWALEQGRRQVRTRLTLLVDADIELQPGLVRALRTRMQEGDLQLASVMVVPHMRGFWERLLMPAFVYFFKLLYPFRPANSRRMRLAAAAGGCILLETRAIDAIGGFAALKDALIDDCMLARRVKARGHRTWIGLTHSARSLRAYGSLGEIWNMVARCAYTQLRYSAVLLGACTALMAIGFWAPVLGLLHPDPVARALAAIGLLALMASYLPTLRFYGRSPAWALALPVVGALFLAMTWTSAIRYWRGEGACWKDRSYGAGSEATGLSPADTDAEKTRSGRSPAARVRNGKDIKE